VAVDLEETLIAWLKTKPEVTGELDRDANSDPHIYSDVLPKEARQERSLVLHEISGQHEEHLTGTSTLAHMRIQFDCHGPSPKQARRTRQAIKTALQAFFRGNMLGLMVSGIQHAGDFSTDTPPQDGSSQFRFTRSTDFQFTYQTE
jgi:hypothetical protein